MSLKFDEIKKLHQKKYREEFGFFLAEGEHLILELEKAALKNKALEACELFVTENYLQGKSRFKIHRISEKQMAQLSDTKSPQGVVALVPLLAVEPLTGVQEKQRAIYLYEVQDPGNLGAILRSLAWFGSFRCLLSPGSVDPFNSKVVRASMGAIFHVPIEVDVPLESLSSRYATVAVLDMHGRAVSDQEFKSCDCYLFGNEARGVPRDFLSTIQTQAFTIPGGQAIESLNLAAAVNMCLYELNRQ
jgi:RNA methyltransferase, TrmH family